MERIHQLTRALRQTMSKDEIEKFHQYKLSQEDYSFLKDTATAVFHKIPFKGFNCAVMNALWYAFIKDHSAIPVAAMCGSLHYSNKKVFHCQSAIPVPNESMKSAELCDGHCWLEFGGFVADISMGRTLALENVPADFHSAWNNAFGDKGSLIIAEPNTFLANDIHYIPQYSMPEKLVNGLIAAIA